MQFGAMTLYILVEENVPQLSQHPIKLCTLNSRLNGSFYHEIPMFESKNLPCYKEVLICFHTSFPIFL